MLRIGQRFERLVIIDRAGSDKHGKRVWLCRCDCGKSVMAATGTLRSGHTTSCGCLRREQKPNLRHGFTGGHQRSKKRRLYSRWNAMRRRCLDEGIEWDSRWSLFENFFADMGMPPHGARLARRDQTQPFCKENCWWKPNGSTDRRTGKISQRWHGWSNTKTHRSWKNMKQRCLNARRPQWKDWGGRGIGYDPRWDSFTAFLDDMGEAPSWAWLERIDNDLGYSKANCKWATPKEQAVNRRVTLRLTYRNRTMTVKEWAETLGLHYGTLIHRLRRGWPLKRALSAGTYHRSGKFTPFIL